MSLQTQQITSASIKMTVTESVLSPLTESMSINVPITFANVSGLKVYKGTYTPSNDTLTIVSGLVNATNPTFILIIVDAPTTVNIQGSSGTVLYEQVTKVLLKSVQSTSGYYVSSIVLDGRTAAGIQMSQGQPVNYTIITCLGTIT